MGLKAQVVPGPLTALDGTQVHFWRLPPGTKWGRRSHGLGATVRWPDGRVQRTWGHNLRRVLNSTPGLPGLTQLVLRANETRP